MSDPYSNLSPSKRRLLSQLIQEEAARRKAAARQTLAIPRANREALIPLSFAQQRLWFIDQLEPGSALYNMATAVRLSGNLDVGALRQTIREIVRRHEVLRTTFRSVNGQPSQLIQPTASPHIPIIDISKLPEPEREKEALRLATIEAQKPFDLAAGPMLRASLLRLRLTEHVALFTTHHIASDGWSMQVLVREVVVLYDAFCRAQPSPLPELEIQYADYAVWQRGWLQGEVLEQNLSYWRDQLADIPTGLDLPTDRPRPLLQTHRGASHTYHLPQELSAALADFSKNEGVTLYMTLLAAFQVLLHRYAGQYDIAVGTSMANRTYLQTEPMIGFFINTLVMRADLSGNPSFRHVLDRIKATALAAHAHQSLPFEMLVEALQPERKLNQNPLFQVSFVLNNQPVVPFKLGDLSLQFMEVNPEASLFDLSLEMAETPEGLRTAWYYSADLFDPSTISRLGKHFQHLLSRVVAAPEQCISSLPLLSAAERDQILFAWNDTRKDFPDSACIHHLFEDQVKRSTDRIAVVGANDHLTYQELDRRANQLARFLQQQGAGLGARVAICMERAPEMMVSVLGTLKAGAAYVPLDPSYPLQRLAAILDDSSVQVLLTQQRVAESLPVHNAQVICVDSEWEERIASECREPAISTVTADDAAYVIYTSGSTGRPKGILLHHRGLCNLTVASNRLFDVSADSRVLQFSSFGFDVSVWETFMALVAGAPLCLNSQNTSFSIEDLQDRLRRQQITVALLSPSVLRLLPAENLPALRTVIAVGEKCTAQNVARWAEGREFFNGYGPAEATVTVSAYLTDAGDNRPQGPPIGRPLENTELYILDRDLEPVPVRVRGELCIGGEGVAIGYINQPAATAEKFVPHPFSRRAGERLYRTGDMGRYLADGNLEFAGRADHQVKVRGYRIELEEVENAIMSSGLVKEAVVVVKEDEQAEKRLVAYVVRREGAKGEALQATLREYLREQLPGYMIPAAIMELSEMPLTSNGKVSRQALPQPEYKRFDSDGEFEAPRTEIEKAICALWQETLKIDQISIHDNFFDLGGHSLLLVQVYTRLQDMFDRELTMLDMFKYASISSLSRYLSKDHSEEPSLSQFQDRAKKQKEALRQQKNRARAVNPASGYDAQKE